MYQCMYYYDINMLKLYNTGKVKQEVSHDNFTDIDYITGMCITSGGILWAAASKGLLQILLDAKLVPASKCIVM